MKRLLVVASLLGLTAQAASAASVTGRVTFVTKRGQNPVPTETLVWLEPAAGTRVARPAPVTTQMRTKGKTLIPHVIAVPSGSTVGFPNEDPISHNIFSLTGANQFDLGLYRTGAGKSHTFKNAGVVNVYCNVHPNMSAVVHVMDSPHYAFADAQGNFSIPNVPPGTWDVVAWNEQAGTIRNRLVIGATAPPPLSLTLDSRGYRATTHTNKHGKPYQAPRNREY